MELNNNFLKIKLIQTMLHAPDDLDESVSGTISDLCKEKGEKWINNVIRKEKIVPFAAHILMNTQNNQMFWEKIHKKYEERTSLIISMLEDIFFDFATQGLDDLVIYENLGALLVSNSCLGCFSSGDVDISANIEDKEEINEVLMKHGFIDVERRGKKNSKIMTTYHNSKVLESGFYINCSWQPVSRRFVYNNEKLKHRIERARKNGKTFKTTKIKVLAVNELMYFSILHIALGHYYVISPSYRLYVDIDRLARSLPIDWDMIFQWAKKDGMEHRFILTLKFSNMILDTPVPQKLLNEFDNKSKYKRLFRYLYDEKYEKFIERGSRIEKLLIDFFSDDERVLNGIINRLANSFRL